MTTFLKRKYQKILELFYPKEKEIEKHKKALNKALGWSGTEDKILFHARKLLALGVSKEEVADTLSEHEKFFGVMKFAMKLKPELAKKFAEANVVLARLHLEHYKNRDHATRAHDRIIFAGRCYKITGFFPQDFKDVRQEVFEKTAWAL